MGDRYKLKLLLLQLAIIAVWLFAAGPAFARFEQRDNYSLTAYYTSYVSSGLSSGAATGQPPPSYDLEAAVRLQGIFSLTADFSMFKSPDLSDPNETTYQITGYGLGMKVDLPGFFFYHGRRIESIRETKLKPVNTFLFGEILKANLNDLSKNIASTTTTPRYGFGVDVFPFNDTVYFAFRIALFNLLGVTSFSYAGGFGIRF
jgi:hypothetical protein